ADRIALVVVVLECRDPSEELRDFFDAHLITVVFALAHIPGLGKTGPLRSHEVRLAGAVIFPRLDVHPHEPQQSDDFVFELVTLFRRFSPERFGIHFLPRHAYWTAL